jgi:hypothetical protein
MIETPSRLLRERGAHPDHRLSLNIGRVSIE